MLQELIRDINPGASRELQKALLAKIFENYHIADVLELLTGHLDLIDLKNPTPFVFSEEQVRRVRDGTLSVDELIEAIVAANPDYLLSLMGRTHLSRKKPDGIEVCKEVHLGCFKTGEQYLIALKKERLLIGENGEYLLKTDAFARSVASIPTKVGVVFISNSELGFPNGAFRRDSFKRIKQMSLDLCPAEMGSALRYQYRDQPIGGEEGSLNIAMDPIIDKEGYLSVFYLTRNESGLCLCAERGNPPGFFSATDRWVVIDPEYKAN